MLCPVLMVGGALHSTDSLDLRLVSALSRTATPASTKYTPAFRILQLVFAANYYRHEAAMMPLVGSEAQPSMML